jgi:hypothetical protein
MNEFIVYDSVKKEFVDDVSYLIDKQGDLFFADFETTTGSGLDGVCFVMGASETKKAFSYIGKKDIDGNKIYADCSIVELRITFDVGNTYETMMGYFRYNELALCYEFIEPLGDNFSRRKWNYSRYDYKIADLKTIGTLQENPELLK